MKSINISLTVGKMYYIPFKGKSMPIHDYKTCFKVMDIKDTICKVYQFQTKKTIKQDINKFINVVEISQKDLKQFENVYNEELKKTKK